MNPTPNPPPPPVIRYSPPHEAEIALAPAAAVALADLIARGGGEMAGDPAADPKPYRRLLDAVRITTAPGKVVLAVDNNGDGDSDGDGGNDNGDSDSDGGNGDGDGQSANNNGRVLTITGAPEHLAVLADVVRDLAGDPDPDTHVHVEYFDGHYYLAESDVGLVLRIVR